MFFGRGYSIDDNLLITIIIIIIIIIIINIIIIISIIISIIHSKQTKYNDIIGGIDHFMTILCVSLACKGKCMGRWSCMLVTIHGGDNTLKISSK